MKLFDQRFDPEDADLLGDLPETVEKEKVQKKTAESVRNRVLGSAPAAKRRAVVLRRRLIPVAAALLIAAILVPTVVVLNRAPEPQTEPEAEVQADVLTKEESAVRETEQCASESDVQTNRTSVWIPQYPSNNPYTAGFDSGIKWFPYLVKAPYVLVRITGVDKTDTLDSKREPCNELKSRSGGFVKVNCELLYHQGVINRRDKEYDIADFLERFEPAVYLPTSIVQEENVAAGDLYFARLTGSADAEPYTNIRLFLGASVHCLIDSEWTWEWADYSPVKDGLLTNARLEIIDYNENLDYIKRKIGKDCDIVNHDLTERMPQSRIESGSNIDNVIEICEWFRELDAAVKMIPSATVSDSYDLVVKDDGPDKKPQQEYVTTPERTFVTATDADPFTITVFCTDEDQTDVPLAGIIFDVCFCIPNEQYFSTPNMEGYDLQYAFSVKTDENGVASFDRPEGMLYITIDCFSTPNGYGVSKLTAFLNENENALDWALSGAIRRVSKNPDGDPLIRYYDENGGIIFARDPDVD